MSGPQRLWITPANRAARMAAIADMERIATYPLGDDAFQIDHGPDYFAFFDRLGDVLYMATVDGERVASVGCGILREVPFRAGEAPQRSWYFCDLKVHPDYRGRHLPLMMLRGARFFRNYLRCNRGYMITMNPGDGSPNRVVKLIQRFRWTPFALGPLLNIYALDAEEAAALDPVITGHRGPIAYTSLLGVKDLILRSTGQPLPLVHLEWGPGATGNRPGPQPGHTHMLCAPAGDPLALALAARDVAPTATASVLHHGMGPSDWRFVSTSAI